MRFATAIHGRRDVLDRCQQIWRPKRGRSDDPGLVLVVDQDRPHPRGLSAGYIRELIPHQPRSREIEIKLGLRNENVVGARLAIERGTAEMRHDAIGMTPRIEHRIKLCAVGAEKRNELFVGGPERTKSRFSLCVACLIRNQHRGKAKLGNALERRGGAVEQFDVIGAQRCVPFTCLPVKDFFNEYSVTIEKDRRSAHRTASHFISFANNFAWPTMPDDRLKCFEFGMDFRKIETTILSAPGKNLALQGAPTIAGIVHLRAPLRLS